MANVIRLGFAARTHCTTVDFCEGETLAHTTDALGKKKRNREEEKTKEKKEKKRKKNPAGQQKENSGVYSNVSVLSIISLALG